MNKETKKSLRQGADAWCSISKRVKRIGMTPMLYETFCAIASSETPISYVQLGEKLGKVSSGDVNRTFMVKLRQREWIKMEVDKSDGTYKELFSVTRLGLEILWYVLHGKISPKLKEAANA